MSPRSRIRCTKCETISRLAELHPDTPRKTAALSPVGPGSPRAQSSVSVAVPQDSADVPSATADTRDERPKTIPGLSISTLGEHAFEQVPDAKGTSRIGRPSGSVVAEMPDEANLRQSAAPVRVAGLDDDSAIPPELLPASLPPRRGVGGGEDTNFPVMSDKEELPRDPEALRRAKASATRGLNHDVAAPPEQPSLDDLTDIEDEADEIPDEIPTPERQQSESARATEVGYVSPPDANSVRRDDATTRIVEEPPKTSAEVSAIGDSADVPAPDDGGMLPDSGGMFPDDGGMFPSDGGMFPPSAAQVAGLDKLATTEDSFPIPLAAFDQPVYRPRKSGSLTAVDSEPQAAAQDASANQDDADETLLSDAEAFLNEALAGGSNNTLSEPSGSVSSLDSDAADFVQNAFDAQAESLATDNARSAPSSGLNMRETMPAMPSEEFQEILRNSAEQSLPGAGGALTEDGEHAELAGFGARPSPQDDDSDPFGVPAPHQAAIPGVRGPSGEHSALHNLAKVEGTVDPLVEFGEMFREARAGEAEDPAATAALADIMLGDQFGGERAGKQADELQLMGGSTSDADQGDPFRRERVSMPSGSQGRVQADPPPGPRHTDTTDAMLGEAMTASEHDAAPPAPAPKPEKAVRRRARTEELDGVGDNRKATYFLSTLLVTLLTLLGVVGFIAYKNDGFLDLKEPDQMIGVAFKDQPYLPRFRTVLRTSEDGSEAEVPADGETPIGDAPLAVRDITSGYYTNAAGTEFVLLHGAVENQTEIGFRRLVVLAELVDSTGQVVRSRLVPAGQRVDQPALEGATSAAGLNEIYASISTAAEDLLIAPTNLTPFTAVFLVRDGESVEGLTYRAEVQRGERQTTAPWRGVSFGPMPEVTD